MRLTLLLFTALLWSLMNLTAQAAFIMPTTGELTTTDCEGTLFDSGGANGNYANNENGLFIINTPGANPIELTFVSFETETNFDGLLIYDGPDANAPLLAELTGGISPAPVVSSGPNITLRFLSDGSVTDPGWELNWASLGGVDGADASFNVSSATPLLNEPVTFSVADGTNSRLLVDFGDGSPQQTTQSSIDYSYVTAGTYTITSTDTRCLDSDVTTQEITVTPGTTITVNPESICDTLFLGELAEHIVTISNTGNQDSYFGVTSPTFELVSFTSVQEFNTSGATTMHSFTDVPDYVTSLTVDLAVFEDFDNNGEEVTVFLEGTELTTIGSANFGGDFYRAQVILTGELLATAIADGMLDFSFVNTSNVDPFFGNDFHEVTISYESFSYTTIDVAGDEIAAGDFIEATINLDATGLLPGLYETSYVFQTSNSEQPNIEVPVKLLVLGTPIPTLAPNPLDFGIVFSNQVATEQLVIGNDGSSDYDVESVTVTNDGGGLFSVPQVAYTSVPFSDSTFTVTFAGTETLGTYTGEITVITNLSTTIIPLSVEVAVPPIAALGPDDFCLTVDAESMTDTFLNLSNSSTTQLSYELVNFSFNDESSIDFEGFRAVTVHEFGPLPSGLTEIDMLITLTGDFSSNFEEATMTVNDFFSVTLADNDLFDGTPDVIPVTVPLADYDGGPITITIENSNAVEPGNFPNNHTVAFNVQPAEWLVVGNQVGTLAGNSETTLPFIIDATGLNGGDYTGQLLFTSSDPELASRLINVKLTVIGMPILTLSQDTLDFGDVFVSTSEDLGLLIENTGSDTLFIDNFFFTNGRFSIDTTFLTLPPDEGYLATVSYAPTSMGASGGSLDIISGSGEVIGTLRVQGVGVDVPEARFDPASICVNLITGADSTATLTLINEGLGDLDYAYQEGSLPDWLTANSATAGTILPGESTTMSFTFSAAGLLGDTYTHLLNFDINEPNAPSPVVEMKMIVQSEPEAIPSAVRTTVCDGVVEFVDQSLYTPTSWSWDFGDGNTSTEQNPVHTYAADGQYTVTLEVCNLLGCNTATLFTPITVALDGSLCQDVTFVDGETIEVTGCGGQILDDGGAESGYSNSFSGQLLITSEEGLSLRLIVDEFLLEFCCDFLTIYDGGDANATEIGSYNGDDLMAGDIIESTGTQLFITFTSDFSVTSTGFQLRYECFLNTRQPTTSFVPSTTTSCDGMVDFMDTSENIPTSWTWNFGDGNTSTEQNPSHTYTTSGQYFVSLEACNEFGCNEVTSEVAIIVSLEEDICQETIMENGELIEVTRCGGVILDNGGATENYDNNFAGQVLINSTDGSAIRVIVDEFLLEFCCDFLTLYDGGDDTAPLIGEYNGADLMAGDVLESTGPQLYLTFTSDGSVTSTGFQLRYECFTNTRPPSAAFQPFGATSCDGAVSFMDTSVDNPTSWSWNFGDGNTSTQQNPSHTYAASGQYFVSLEVCNEFGCDVVTAGRPIIVSLEEDICQETVFVDGQQLDITGCAGRITDDGGSESNYSDDFNGQALLTSATGEQLLLIVDDFLFEFCCDFLTIYDGADANAPLIGEYNGDDLMPGDEIISSGSQLFITFTADGSVNGRGFDIRWQCITPIQALSMGVDPQVDCPATYNFTVNNVGMDEYTYAWDFGDGQVAEGLSPQHTFPTAGSYNMSVVVTGDGQSRTISQTVVISDVNFELSLDGTTELLINQAGEFTAQASTELSNYNWYAEGTDLTSTEQSFSPVWTEPGVYRVWLTTTNGTTNCEGNAFIDVTVTMDTRTTDHSAVSALEVFPNPTRSQLNFNLQLDRELELSYQVFDATGRRVMQNQFFASGRELTERLDVSNLPSGMYHVTLISSELGQVATRRFVKE